jgi:hypothetical protein
MCCSPSGQSSGRAAAQYERYQVAPGLVDVDVSCFQRTFAEARDASIPAAAAALERALAAYSGELLAHTHYTGQSRVEWSFGSAVVDLLVRSPNSVIRPEGSTWRSRAQVRAIHDEMDLTASNCTAVSGGSESTSAASTPSRRGSLGLDPLMGEARYQPLPCPEGNVRVRLACTTRKAWGRDRGRAIVFQHVGSDDSRTHALSAGRVRRDGRARPFRLADP